MILVVKIITYIIHILEEKTSLYGAKLVGTEPKASLEPFPNLYKKWCQGFGPPWTLFFGCNCILFNLILYFLALLNA